VRLRSCVAIELAVGAVVSAACAGAAMWAASELRGAGASEARAETIARPDIPPPPPVADRDLRALVRPPPSKPWAGSFGGQPDQALLEPLRDAAIAKVVVNRGGSSLSLRIDLENGARAACKTVQIHPHSQPRREIAAYRINRLLGLASVPPAVGRRFHISDIVDHLRSRDQRARILAEAVPEHDGTVLAELSWWIPVLKSAEIDGYAIDSTDGVVTWKRYLRAGSQVPEPVAGRVAQVSDLVLFDFIINNSDRWSGGNVKASEDGEMLYFMDNTLSFGEHENGKVRRYFERSQKFSRALVERLRSLSEEEVRAALADDIAPFDSLLSDGEISALMARRDRAVATIDQLIERHGADLVLAFP
jgi:hypothetical protein